MWYTAWLRLGQPNASGWFRPGVSDAPRPRPAGGCQWRGAKPTSSGVRGWCSGPIFSLRRHGSSLVKVGGGGAIWVTEDAGGEEFWWPAVSFRWTCSDRRGWGTWDACWLRRRRPAGGVHRAAVAHGMAAGKGSIPTNLRRLGKVGELGEHQGKAAYHQRAREAGNNSIGRVFARGRKWRSQRCRGVLIAEETGRGSTVFASPGGL
jgi:hypothetical protein